MLLRGRERLGRSVRELLLVREPPCSHGMHMVPHFTSSSPHLLTGESLGRSVRELLLLLLLERLGTVGTVAAECVLKTLSTAALMLRGRATLGRSLLELLLLEITGWAAGCAPLVRTMCLEGSVVLLKVLTLSRMDLSALVALATGLMSPILLTALSRNLLAAEAALALTLLSTRSKVPCSFWGTRLRSLLAPSLILETTAAFEESTLLLTESTLPATAR